MTQEQKTGDTKKQKKIGQETAKTDRAAFLPSFFRFFVSPEAPFAAAFCAPGSFTARTNEFFAAAENNKAAYAAKRKKTSEPFFFSKKAG